jgi:membrane protease subunit (stomatin/prohibitin family)
MAAMGVGLGAGVGFGQVVGQVMGAALQPASAAAGVSADEVVSTLEKLHGLVEKGILSQAEFDAKKAELLKKLS